jgi:hypothetical protein
MFLSIFEVVKASLAIIYRQELRAVEVNPVRNSIGASNPWNYSKI